MSGDATHYNIEFNVNTRVCHAYGAHRENWRFLRLLLFDTNMLFYLLSTFMIRMARVTCIRINMIYLIPLGEQSFPVRSFFA